MRVDALPIPTEQTSRRAYALLLVLVVILLLSAAGFLVAAQMQNRVSSALDEGRNVHLRNLVDSGIALGLARIHEERFWSGQFEQVMDGGSVECKIEFRAESRREMLVEALYGGERWRYHVEVFVQPARKPRVVDLRFVSSGSDEESLSGF